MLTFEDSLIGPLSQEQEDLSFFVKEIEEKMMKRVGKGSEFLGWLDLPTRSKNDLEKIQKIGDKTKTLCDVLVVIGIGGSYLGAKALWDALGPYYGSNPSCPELLFLGTDLSGEHIRETLEYLDDKEICVNVISKSGTTLEPAVAFSYIRNYMKKRYGEDVKNRIIITTDRIKGALRPLVNEEGYSSFIVPDDVGGRYSVFTPVGLFPLAVGGIDIQGLLYGAEDAMKECNTLKEKSPSARYAIGRQRLQNEGKDIEILGTYDPKLALFGDWYIQLFGESEGKEGKGIYPSSLLFTRDLHSMGQMIQEGKRNIFETLVHVLEEPKTRFESSWELTGIESYKDISVEEMNQAAYEGTKKAHLKGEVPIMEWILEKRDAYHMGGLIYYFQRACGISAYLTNVNPFDQPGVEEYKKRMFSILDQRK
ncbi:MAG: glucose-6-phosphate isomerase [Tissierellia bacterium]|nr:glucose-6-phosphate isomerase [Tissierellia bacterium]